MYFYQSGNSNGIALEPWFIFVKVLGWHYNIIIIHQSRYVHIIVL